MNYQALIKTNKFELLITILVVLIALFLPAEFLALLPLSVLLIGLGVKYKDNFVLIFTIVTFLTVTTTISPAIRILVQLLNLLLLGIFFIKQYGFEFKNYPAVPLPLGLFFIFLFCLMFISSFNSNLSLGLEQIIRLAVFLLIVYFYYSFIYLKEKNNKLIINAVYAVAIIYGLFLIYEFAETGFNIIEYNIKQVNYLGNDYLPKNQMGGFFSMIITLSIAYLFYYKSKAQKVFLYSIIVLSSISLILLNSRTSILTALIGFIFLALILNRKILKYAFAALVLVSSLMLIDDVYNLFEIYFRFEKLSTGRDYILAASANVIRDNWFLGAGPAGTKYELYKDLPYMLGTPVEKFLFHHYNQIEFGHAHNFYLFFFSDLGIFGFILSLVFPLLFFRYSYRVLQTVPKNSYSYYTVLGITGSGICMFIRGIFEWGGLISYGTISYDLPFWLLFIILISFVQKLNPQNLTA